jgi:uncharacterized protein (TIGR01777 family)
MRILIAGGSGLLGSRLGTALQTDGHDVRILTRTPRRDGDIRWRADASDTGWWDALTGAGAVINLAGSSIAGGRWTPARKAEIRDSRRRATRAIVAGLDGTSTAAVLVSGSAVGYYGLHGDEPLTEDAAPGSDFLASVCRDWERAALETTSAVRVVLLRTGLVLARDGGALPPMALPFRFGAGGRIGSGRQVMSWIHIDDWVGIVRWVLATPAITGPINLTAPAPVTNTVFTRALAKALRRPAVVPAPAFALRLLLGEMADALILGGQRVVPRKAIESGYRFRYAAIDDALGEIYGIRDS